MHWQVTSTPKDITRTSWWARWRLKSPASPHQSSATQAFVRRIHRWPVNSPHKGPVTRKMFPFDDVSMNAPNLKTNIMSMYSWGQPTLNVVQLWQGNVRFIWSLLIYISPREAWDGTDKIRSQRGYIKPMLDHDVMTWTCFSIAGPRLNIRKYVFS